MWGIGVSVYLNSVGDNFISKYKLCHEKKKKIKTMRRYLLTLL